MTQTLKVTKKSIIEKEIEIVRVALGFNLEIDENT